MKSQLTKVLNYYAFFNYAPSLEHIFNTISLKIERSELEQVLEQMVRNKQLAKRNFNSLGKDVTHYAFPEKSHFFREMGKRLVESQRKLEKVRRYISILSYIPQVRFVGLSGSVAMMNASSNGDVDLFIIIEGGRLWTGRFIAVALAAVFGLRKESNPARVCLNLFFDEEHLTVPKRKQNEYVAHEVVQVKPVVMKGDVYSRFLSANQWVTQYFPNLDFSSISSSHSSEKSSSKLDDKIEEVMKKYQLQIMKKRKTDEVVERGQLWLFREDFEKRMKKANK